MPSFPAFKTKPYYDALKAWLTTSLNEDGTLRSDAVQAEVSAAIAAEPTVVDAAAAAVDANPTIASLTPAAEGQVVTSDGTNLVSSPNAVTPGDEIFIATPWTPAHLRRRADYAFDSLTTNHTVLQQAIDDIVAAGMPRVLRIDGGRVRMSDTVQWDAKVSLHGGHGNGTSAANRTALVWAGAAGGLMFDTTDAGTGYIHKMFLRNLQLIGYNTDPNIRAAGAVRFRSYLDLGSDMRDFQAVGFSGDVFRYDRGGHNLFFKDFRIDDMQGYGFLFTPENERGIIVNFADFTVDNYTTYGATGGGFVHFDLSGSSSDSRASFASGKLETNTSHHSGEGMVRVSPNPDSPVTLQFIGSFANVVNQVRPGQTGTSVVVSPATDMVTLSATDNCQLTFSGVPALANSLSAPLNNRAFLVAAPIAHDMQVTGGNQNRRSLSEFVGNLHVIGNLWQHRRKAQTIIMNTLNAADWDFPTRLDAGMLFQNPAYKSAARMELEKVTNDGATAGSVSGITATGTSGTATITVNQVGNLQIGHYITIAGVVGWRPIVNIDAGTNTITLGSNLSATVSGAAVGLYAPTSQKYQIPHKATAAPSSGTWERGDVVWNSSATAGGKAGWICVTAGTPGTWKAFGVIDA